MNFLREWVLPNWPLKLLALAISFLLWSTYTSEPVADVGYLAPLEFRNVPQGLEISTEMPTQVHVRLRGRSLILRRLVPADLTISIDLSGRAAGETLVRLTPEQVDAPFGTEVAAIAPREIRVRLVPRAAAR